MKSNDKDARERIIEVTLNLLNEVDDIEEITVRKIAERANVGVGLINYHFKTKDNLLSTAIGDVMSNIIAELYDDSVYTLRPIEDLKNLLKKLCDTGLHYEKVLPFVLNQCITNGDMQAELDIVPMLRKIFGNKKDETYRLAGGPAVSGRLRGGLRTGEFPHPPRCAAEFAAGADGRAADAAVWEAYVDHFFRIHRGRVYDLQSGI